jgi:hypothetical protein
MRIPMAKPPKMSGGKAPSMPGAGDKASKPHIRMRKLKTVAPSAFPPTPMAFPPDPNAGAPDAGQAMAAQPGGMSTGAGPGDMGT